MGCGRPPAWEKFWSRVEQVGDCWMWTGATAGSKSTYGYFYPEDRTSMTYAHRWVYEQAFGPIPDGWHVDHLCRAALCCNPAHLEAVTPEENYRRTRLAVCRSGRHDLTVEENVHWKKDGTRGGCRPCMLERCRKHANARYARLKREKADV